MITDVGSPSCWLDGGITTPTVLYDNATIVAAIQYIAPLLSYRLN